MQIPHLRELGLTQKNGAGSLDDLSCIVVVEEPPDAQRDLQPDRFTQAS